MENLQTSYELVEMIDSFDIPRCETFDKAPSESIQIESSGTIGDVQKRREEFRPQLGLPITSQRALREPISGPVLPEFHVFACQQDPSDSGDARVVQLEAPRLLLQHFGRLWVLFSEAMREALPIKIKLILF